MVFKRRMKVVWVMRLSPLGPFFDPIAWRNPDLLSTRGCPTSAPQRRPASRPDPEAGFAHEPASRSSRTGSGPPTLRSGSLLQVQSVQRKNRSLAVWPHVECMLGPPQSTHQDCRSQRLLRTFPGAAVPECRRPPLENIRIEGDLFAGINLRLPERHRLKSARISSSEIPSASSIFCKRDAASFNAVRSASLRLRRGGM